MGYLEGLGSRNDHIWRVWDLGSGYWTSPDGPKGRSNGYEGSGDLQEVGSEYSPFRRYLGGLGYPGWEGSGSEGSRISR